jgi:antitoxin PrlF
MATTVTVKGQVTLPKAVREAAGIKPGDRVEVRSLPTGGILIEREAGSKIEAYRRQLEEVARRQPFKGMTAQHRPRDGARTSCPHRP